MGKVVSQIKNGTSYYYLEESVRIGAKVKKVREYLGKKKPNSKELNRLKNKLTDESYLKIYSKSLEEYKSGIFSNKELAELEAIKDNYLYRLSKLSKNRREEAERQFVLDFVYTTLRTEGVNVGHEDVETAFSALKKKKGEFTLNDKVIISSSMITGFNYLSKINVNDKDVLKLHGIIMTTFEHHSPGQLRDDQRIIARVNPVTFESKEINYRPPAPEKVPFEFSNFFEWFNKNKTLHPFELAVLVHLKIYLVHPFKDGNKRMCRLLFNKILQDNNYPTLNISKETSNYFKTLIESVETNNPKFFADFCRKTFIKQIKNKRLK